MTTKADLLQCNNSEVLIRVPRWLVRDMQDWLLGLRQTYDRPTNFSRHETTTERLALVNLLLDQLDT